MKRLDVFVIYDKEAKIFLTNDGVSEEFEEAQRYTCTQACDLCDSLEEQSPKDRLLEVMHIGDFKNGSK